MHEGGGAKMGRRWRKNGGAGRGNGAGGSAELVECLFWGAEERFSGAETEGDGGAKIGVEGPPKMGLGALIWGA